MNVEINYKEPTVFFDPPKKRLDIDYKYIEKLEYLAEPSCYKKLSKYWPKLADCKFSLNNKDKYKLYYFVEFNEDGEPWYQQDIPQYLYTPIEIKL